MSAEHDEFVRGLHEEIAHLDELAALYRRSAGNAQRDDSVCSVPLQVCAIHCHMAGQALREVLRVANEEEAARLAQGGAS